jgi:serine/threonine protein kinase
METSDLPQLG